MAVCFLCACAHAASAEDLRGLIEAAVSTHPSVLAQKALTLAAAGEFSSARWQFYPTPSVTVEKVSAGASDINYRYGDQRVTTLRLSQPLWTGGRLTAGLRKAQAGGLASDAGLEITRQELAIRVVQAYADWYGGHFKSVALQASLQAHQRLRVQIERRIEQGASPVIDRVLVEGRIEQVQAEFIAAQTQQAGALSNLSQLVGKPVLASALLAVVSRPLALDPAQSLLEQAQTGNPNVVKLIAIAHTLEATIDERKADLQPEVYLRAERQFGNYAYNNAAPESRIFIGMTTRYGAGLTSQSQVSAAQARLDAALADVQSMRVSLGQQIMADYLMADASELRLRSLKASWQSAANISQAWERQFLAGSKSWLDIMNATREQTQMEVQLAEAQATQVLLTWRLVLLSQGVWPLIDPVNTPFLRGAPPYEPAESPLQLVFFDVLSVASKGLLAMKALFVSPPEMLEK